MDFAFRLTEAEIGDLKFQNETSSWGGRRKRPRVFTEQGVAMLSSVLRSERAVQINVGIMRTFVRMRRALASNKELANRLEKVEKRLNSQDEVLGAHIQVIRSLFEDIKRAIDAPEQFRL